MYGLLRKLLVAAAIAVSSFATPASAQTAPNWYYGKVPTTAEWAAAWASKQDYLGAPPCLVSGCVMRGPLGTVAPSGRAGFNLMPGVSAPTTLFDGDLWVTPSGLFVQVNGTTVGPLLSGVNPTLANLTVTGAFTATGLVTNADLANAATTVNGVTCTLGSTCTITASAGSITAGSTTITGVTSGNVLNNTSGTLGSYAVSGTGSVAMTSSAAMTSPTLTTPVLSGTITGTYTIGGSPSISGGAINSGTVSGTFMSNVNLAASGNGGVTGTLPIANGGTGATTATAAIGNLMPTPTRAGDVAVWSGSAWTTLAGNNSGTQVLSENSSGVAAWLTASGTGTVTSAAVVGGTGITLSGTCSSTSALNCTVSGSIHHPGGRLTLAANTPIMISTSCGGSACANQTTLRYDCYIAGGVPYYNGTNDMIDPITSCEVTDAMVSAASAGQVVASNVYDVWWVHGGANRICLAMSSATGGGGGWSADTGGSNTARGTGYSAIDQTTRSYATNKNALTNCFNGSTNYGSVSANQATYLGTVYANGNGQVSYVPGSGASGGGAALLGVWNMHNQIDVRTSVNDTKTSWVFSAGTIRQSDLSANNRVTFVTGLPVNGLTATFNQSASTAATGAGGRFGFAMDSTTAFDMSGSLQQSGSGAMLSTASSSNYYDPVVGLHFIQALETAYNSLTVTVLGGAAGNNQALSVGLRM